jgi:hypothetical protein
VHTHNSPEESGRGGGGIPEKQQKACLFKLTRGREIKEGVVPVRKL